MKNKLIEEFGKIYGDNSGVILIFALMLNYIQIITEDMYSPVPSR